QLREFLQHGPLLIIEIATQFLQFDQDGIERLPRFQQVPPKILRSGKENIQLADVEFGDDRGFCFRTEHERLCLLAQIIANRGNFFINHFAATRREPAWQNAAQDQARDAAGRDQNIEPRQRALEPAGGNTEVQVNQKQNNREETGVNVNLQPGL